jgi:hypothetical protein
VNSLSGENADIIIIIIIICETALFEPQPSSKDPARYVYRYIVRLSLR